ncbi:ubiquinone/menaquinone biosynthesis C-methylase UbiE [Nocardioides sp. BE266]|uniref:class I SAM-dependent methyltransferase n=1 Tax=Nocardioides sp. BE266 TaxID=2817725 RepID=UPI00286017F8|nr:class I SAM-dependent methyltransferase [Nocardioides sp. BE266]MDR7254849.1 ubiquinone/menaquinone biosynthesis C-methylase UbiE [Nocardioides sp. BE266]
MRRPRRLVGAWSEDPLWARVYPRLVDNPVVGAPLWRLGLGTDIGRLYAATREIGELPDGARVLDVPTGSGVALRGLRPGGHVDLVAADISPRMLERSVDAARRWGVADQVTTTIADVGELPFADGTFHLVVSFTGLHVFPDPHRAIGEMVRVLAPGGVISGSALFADEFHGVERRYGLVHAAGRAAHVLGPMCSSAEAVQWLGEAGAVDVRLEMSGGLGYFRATARPV